MARAAAIRTTRQAFGRVTVEIVGFRQFWAGEIDGRIDHIVNTDIGTGGIIRVAATQGPGGEQGPNLVNLNAQVCSEHGGVGLRVMTPSYL
jgi:hypothetical protein